MKFIFSLFPIILLTNGCATAGEFDNGLLTQERAAITVIDLVIRDNIATAQVELHNESSGNFCFADYSGKPGRLVPSIVFDRNFAERPLSAGSVPEVNPTIGVIPPGSQRVFSVIGGFAGKGTELVERGRFLIKFVGVDCYSPDKPEIRISDVFFVSRFLK